MRWIASLLLLAAALSGPAVATETLQSEGPELDQLRAAVAADPNNHDLRRNLAIALHGAHLREEAVEQFEILAQAAPTERSLLDLALAYGSVSRLDDAEATYYRLLELSPKNAIAWHNLGNIAFQRDDNDKAIELYSKAIEAKPDYLLAYSHLADALCLAERYKEAYHAYEKVLQLEPTNETELTAFDDALYYMASLDITMGAYERAAKLLAELLRANPEHPKAYYAYGQVLMYLGRTEEAQKALEMHQRIQAKQKPTAPMAHGD